MMTYEAPEIVVVGNAQELILSGSCGCGDCSCSEHGHNPEFLDYEDDAE